MFKQMMSGPGHVASMLAAGAVGVATQQALPAALTYVAGRAFGAAAVAPSDAEMAAANRAEDAKAARRNPNPGKKSEFYDAHGKAVGIEGAYKWGEEVGKD